MSKRKKGSRKSFTFYLKPDNEEQAALAKEIDNLKAHRQFSPTVRDALRLILDLRDGNTDVLGEMFPQLNTGAPDGLLYELEEIKKLLESALHNTIGPEEKAELRAADDLLNELDEIKRLLVSAPNNTIGPEEKIDLGATVDLLDDLKEIKKLLETLPHNTIGPEEKTDLRAADDLLYELEEIKKLLLSSPANTVLSEEKTDLPIDATDDFLSELKEIKELLTSILTITVLPDEKSGLSNGTSDSLLDDLLYELKEIKKLVTSTSPMIQPVSITQQSHWTNKKPVITEITEKSVGTGDGSAANNLLSSLNNF